MEIFERAPDMDPITYLLVEGIRELKENGYTVIPNALSSDEIAIARNYFEEWRKNDEVSKMLKTVAPGGLVKFGRSGHTKMAWYIRTRPNVLKVFEILWGTKDLAVSFDGCNFVPRGFKRKDRYWAHWDQNPNNSKEFLNYQGFVSLTSNDERSFVAYPGSHLYFENQLWKDFKIEGTKNWIRFLPEQLQKVQNRPYLNFKETVDVQKGDLVIWDSRVLHQNSMIGSEERLVQYVSYMPKDSVQYERVKEKRQRYFETRRTTSHWVYPLKVNGSQPQHYGDTTKIIDYNKLPEQDISGFECEKLV